MKKSPLLAVIIILVLLVTACSQGSNGGTDSGTNGGTSPSPGNTTAPPQQEETVSIKVMANYNTPEQTESDKKFIAELEEKNNVKLEFVVPPATGYNEQLQLMLASNDYPDVVLFPDSADANFLNAVKEGIVIPVNEYTKNAEFLQRHTYQASWDQLRVTQDDHIYGIPRTSVVRNDAFYLRKDWLDNIGFTLPDNGEITLAQFEEILNKFTNEDPDRNGTKDTYGYGGAYNATNKVLEVIVPGAFGLTGWQASSGGEFEYMNPLYDRKTDNYKKALEFTAKMYTNGYFDPDSATNDSAKQRERFVRGLTGVFPGFAGHYVGINKDLKANNPEAELAYVFVQNDKGTVEGGSLGASSTGLWGFWAITNTAKNPQKIVDVLNSWISDDMWEKTADGYEGIDYEVKDGIKVAMDPPAPASHFRRSSMRRANDTSFFLSVGMSKEQLDLVVPWLEKAIATVVPAKDNAFVPDAAKKPNFIDYTKLWEQTTMKIIMGAEPVTKFDELLEGWYKNGGEEYVAQMNEYIKKMEAGK
ncbi:extracellular solute-binding protein [Paenibacillus agaridevorans]|uniref:extracellular solute-binding protein n=1 Tax=Paenibacillus agaridevorans TaxID=171404 RepID=UPI001BE43163|nr:extracellular solute-binding protein [Paenibacillus agaridevorans]